MLLFTGFIECLCVYSALQASVSLKRIQSFLSHDELDPHAVERKNTGTGRMNAAYHFCLCRCLCFKHASMSAIHWENVLCCYMSSFFRVNFVALLIEGLRAKSAHPTHPVTKSLKSFWMTHSSKTYFSILSCQDRLYHIGASSKGNNVTFCRSTEFSVAVINGKFTWAKEDPAVLHKYVMKSHILSCVCVVTPETLLKTVDCVFVVLTWWCPRAPCWRWWATSAVGSPPSSPRCWVRWRNWRETSLFGYDFTFCFMFLTYQQVTVFIYCLYCTFSSIKNYATQYSHINNVSADHVLRDTLLRGQWHTYLSRPGYRMPRWEITSCLENPTTSRSTPAFWKPVP